MDIQTLVSRVRAKDYAVQTDAKTAGSAAVPDLTTLAHDADEEVRQLAVYCLSATGDPAAVQGLCWALSDSDAQVAMAAAKGLHGLVTPAHVPTLLQAYDRASEAIIRRELGLVLGEVTAPSDIPELQKRWRSEGNLEAKQGLTTTLSRLGDEDARDAFKEGLAASKGPSRSSYLELAESIAQPWLLEPLAEVLLDTSDVLRVAVDARPDLIQALRACDIALVLIANIGKVAFPFPVIRAKNYSAQELDAAAQWVKANAPQP